MASADESIPCSGDDLTIERWFDMAFHKPLSKNEAMHAALCDMSSKISALSLRGINTADPEAGKLDFILQVQGATMGVMKPFHRDANKLLCRKNGNAKVYDGTPCVSDSGGWFVLQSILAKAMDNDTVVLINKTKESSWVFALFPQGRTATWMALFKDNYILCTRHGGAELIQGMVERERDCQSAEYSYECSVCTERFIASTAKFECRHLFCVACTKQMDTCPMCRARPHNYTLSGGVRCNKKKKKKKK